MNDTITIREELHEIQQRLERLRNYIGYRLNEDAYESPIAVPEEHRLTTQTDISMARGALKEMAVAAQSLDTAWSSLRIMENFGTTIRMSRGS